jgi:tripartite-type tricarboxylate transporter receptor subunit TctC
MTISTVTRRAGLALALSLLSTTMLGATAQAQDYPSRTVTLVVPFAAGGSTDLVARVIAQKMSDILGQQVIVQNVGGGGGSIGAANVAKADPDGYTILMATVATHALNPLILKTKPYDAEKDFAPVSLLVVVPNVLVVNPELEAKTVQELIDLLKAKPGEYSYASSGNGTPLHLSGELFKKMAGVDMVHIPYKGSGPALNDVLGNQVPIMFDNLPSSSSHIKGGTLRALGVTTKENAASFPDIPTIAETVPGYETYTWNALFAPAGTPPDVVSKLSQAAAEAMKDPAVKKQLDDFSARVVGSTPDELAAHVKAEIEKWTPIVKDANIQIE